MVRPPGFEPGTPGSGELRQVDWDEFRKWLLREYSPNEARGKYNYARGYYLLLFRGDLSPLHGLSEGCRRHAMKALSALSKYLGCHDYFLALVRQAGLKWNPKGRDYYIISRLTRKTVNPVPWILEVKKRVPSLSLFLDYLAATGLRLIEAINSWNILATRGLEGYYNPETGALEHFRFHHLFLRKTKKAYISFAPMEFLESIQGREALTPNKVNKRLKRRGISRRYGDLREYWATYMTRHLTRPEIDMLQGRVGSSVFMAHYFNPALIADLRTRVLKGVGEILDALS